MSGVRKWELVTSPFCSRMCEDRYGEYVLASDYDALSARCEELERRLAGAWCVRELEWREFQNSNDASDWCAVTNLGDLWVLKVRSANNWRPVIVHDGKWLFRVTDCGQLIHLEEHDTPAAAKAAAQAWFNEKMTAGLRRVGEQQ